MTDDEAGAATFADGPPGEVGELELRHLGAAQAVADGAASGVPYDSNDPVLAQLNVIAQLARVHRELNAADPGTPDLSASLGDVLSRTHGSASRPDLSRADRWGPLFVLEQVGRGAFGDVYRAWDPALDREVALKRVRLPAAAAAQATTVVREGQLLASVNHPNVINVHGAAEIDGEIGIWMEFVRGRTLEQIVTDDGPMSPREASVVAESLCGALTAVHQRGLLHRDIKAANVMRSSGGRIVLLDFGTSVDASTDVPRERRMAGTPLYMAPEVMSGSAASPQSDIYSLGVLLFYLVTASYPVYGKSLAEIKAVHQSGRRPLLADVRSDLPVSFARAVERALSPDPKLRPRTIGEWSALILDSRARSAGLKTAGIVALSAAALATAGIWLVGFLSSLAYNASVGRSGEFARESLLGYWMWGARSLIAPVFVIAVTTLFFRTCWTIARSIWRALPPHAFLRSRRPGRLPTDLVMSEVVIVANAVLLGILCWNFKPIIDATTSQLATTDPSVFLPFQPGNRLGRNLFSVTFSVGLLISVASWLSIERLAYRQSRRVPMPTRFAAAFVALLFLFLLVVPWRLGWQNDGERYLFGAERCYVIGSTASEFLLYCPAMDSPRVRSVSMSDPRLRRDDVVENIFTP